MILSLHFDMFDMIFVFWICLYRSALLCEMEQRLKELNPESGSNVGAIALRRSLPWKRERERERKRAHACVWV